MKNSEFYVHLYFQTSPDRWLSEEEQDALFARALAVLKEHFRVVPNPSYALDSSVTLEFDLNEEMNAQR